MNFQNIQLLGKGTVRKATGPINRDAGFDLRYTHYTKNGKNGQELVSHFVFTKVGLEKTGLLSNEVSAAAFHETGVVGIAVVGAEVGNFMLPAKRSKNGKKSSTVTVNSLIKALAAEGILNTEFEGSQHYELTLLGEDENGKYFQVTKSATIADKAYVADEDEVAETSQDEASDYSNDTANAGAGY
jgi:hypothetical protein